MSDKKTSSDILHTIDNFIPRLPWIPFFRKPKMNFRRPKIYLPHQEPEKYILFILVLSSILLISGALYVVSENPIPMGFTQTGSPELVHPSQHDQFLIETIVVAIFFSVGALGIYLLRFSTRYGYDLRYATSILILAIILIIVGIAGAQIMLDEKG
ncbi:MAG: hypothetical protein ACE5OZ_23680 [Candidatus Heimdallarchaeota archaeon]